MIVAELPYEANLIILQNRGKSIKEQKSQVNKKAFFQHTFF